MVIPWIGFPLQDLINQFELDNSTRYVAFDTIFRPEEMRGQKRMRFCPLISSGLNIVSNATYLVLLSNSN